MSTIGNTSLIYITNDHNDVSIWRIDEGNYSVVEIRKDNEIKDRFRFRNVGEEIDCPYISWENLAYCGWYDKDGDDIISIMLVDRKLFASLGFENSDLVHDGNGRFADDEIENIIKQNDSLMGGYLEDGIEVYMDVFICKKGTISDYIDIENVFSFYEKLGMKLWNNEKEMIKELCDHNISEFATKSLLTYTHPKNRVELVVVGLLLGYPIESTVSILNNKKHFLVKGFKK